VTVARWVNHGFGIFSTEFLYESLTLVNVQNMKRSLICWQIILYLPIKLI